MFLRTTPIALWLLMPALATPACAQPTPPPPEWHDGGASVYLEMSSRSQPADEPAPLARPLTVDHLVAPAVHHEPISADTTGQRHLPPPTRTRSNTEKLDPQGNRLPERPRRFADFGLPLQSAYTVSSALAIVIGAFLTFAWLLRRSGRTTTARLPAEVVSVLGRVPLAARHHAELLRVGNKLVLVSLTPAGAETLTEVTDPVEVDRLLGLCQQSSPHSTTQAFEQVFRQLSSEPATGGLLNKESLATTPVSSAATYPTPWGDASRA